jgi:hypothetical protein
LPAAVRQDYRAPPQTRGNGMTALPLTADGDNQGRFIAPMLSSA